MVLRKGLSSLLFVMVLVISACATPAPAKDVMEQKGASASESAPTADKTMAQPTADAMMTKETPAGDKMAAQPTADAMPAKETPTGDKMAAQPTADAMMAKETPQDAAMTDKAMSEIPLWYGVSLTDVNSGESFTIADLKGKVVLVETMAVWCSTCLRQQREVVKLHEQLGERADFVSVALGVDLNESPEMLQAHAGKHGFDWKYALATSEVARDMAALYGNQFLNPPSAPMLVIDRRGAAHPLPFGVKSAEKLNELLQPFLAEAM